MTDFQNWPIDTITVNNKELQVRLGTINQADLTFYVENPRLYSIVFSAGGMSQEEILNHLLAMDHVKQLIQSIKSNGGLTDPLLVSPMGGKIIVVEGNSRLAAYRALAKRDPAKWALVKCKVLPERTTEDDLFSILGEYHIIGRKDWAPYEQAGYLYRRNRNQKKSIEGIAEELGLSSREVSHLIKVYDFMIEHDENEPSRWSYYDVYFRCNKVKKIRQQYANFDELIIKKIRSGEIATAQALRDKLPAIILGGIKTLKKFIDGEVDFETSYERATLQGAGNLVLKRINKFRMWISETEDIRNSLNAMENNQKDKCFFEIKKIYQAIKSLLRAFNRLEA